MDERRHAIPHRETEAEIPQEALDRQHEQRDLGLGWLFASLFMLVLLIALSVAAMTLLFGFFESREAARDPAPSPMVESPVQPPEPRLENTPGEVLATLQAGEEVLLNSYVWIDREAGIARIPVDRAMEILAERGLPWRGAPARSQDAADSDSVRAPESEP